MSTILKKCFKLIFLNVNKTNKNSLEFFCSKNLTKSPTIPTNNEIQKSIRVAVIGIPNSGKSTFINNLINHRVCPTSCKVHTTRRSNTAIFTEKDTQVLIFDTPGLVTKKEIQKHKLESSFSSAYRHSIQHADIIAVIHDISNSWTRNQLHHTVLDTLKLYPKLPSFLVINKIDLLKSKRVLLDIIKTVTNNTLENKKKLQTLNSPNKKIDQNIKTELEISQKSNGWSHFSDVFMVSSLLGEGLNEVMRLILSKATPKEWQFSPDLYTDDTPEQLIVESVRARLLDYLPQEIPYLLKCEIEHFCVEKNVIYASVQVHCPTARIERLICGESNGKLKQITERITSDLVETFNKPISLTITTHSKNKVSAAATN